MLTRAYDAIMASIQVPMITNRNVDFNDRDIDDSVLNCRQYNGQVCTMASPSYLYSGALQTTSLYPYFYPFACWGASSYTSLLPDEDESDPTYEDYLVSHTTPSGWAIASSYPSFEKTYDPDTKEIVVKIGVLFQNTSGSEKTVYGVKVKCTGNYRPRYDTSGLNSTSFLLCREKFASPVVVEGQGIIALTFTYRVGRAGLVSATAAAAE